MQEGIELSQDEVNVLIDRQISQDATQDMINAIEVLKKNGISLVYKDEKGKIVNTIKKTKAKKTGANKITPIRKKK
jgi:predicted Fe-Mo cluster-binding NifX family protein